MTQMIASTSFNNRSTSKDRANVTRSFNIMANETKIQKFTQGGWPNKNSFLRLKQKHIQLAMYDPQELFLFFPTSIKDSR